MARAGLEPGHYSRSKSNNSPAGGALSGAPSELSTIPAVIDPDLALIIAAWPSLSAEVRAGIVAMVNAANPET
jgi:hypothetical protein